MSSVLKFRTLPSTKNAGLVAIRGIRIRASVVGESACQIHKLQYRPIYSIKYKSYMGDVGNIGTRYTTSNGFYLSVITALLGILALTKTGEIFEGSRIYLGLAVSAFAVLVCVGWWRTIGFYSKLFAIKFEILRQMERDGNLFPIFKKEDDLRKGDSLLKKDRLIPVLLSVPFLLTLVLLLCKLPK